MLSCSDPTSIVTSGCHRGLLGEERSDSLERGRQDDVHAWVDSSIIILLITLYDSPFGNAVVWRIY